MEATYKTYNEALAELRNHDCESESDICDCRFEYPCIGCGTLIVEFGESLADNPSDGHCKRCFYGIEKENDDAYFKHMTDGLPELTEADFEQGCKDDETWADWKAR